MQRVQNDQAHSAFVTQHALAAQSGCAVDTIRKIEAAQRRPSRQLVARLAETLQIPAADHAVFSQLARGHMPAGPCIPPPASAAVPADHVLHTNSILEALTFQTVSGGGLMLLGVIVVPTR
jgi:transcriptional regulator with XRE-family HTH domain